MKFGLILAVAIPALALAQSTPPSSSALNLPSSFFDALVPRELGPTTMGGRIMDLAVYDREPRIFYVATASGGLWKTTNAGTTMTPVFDRERTVSLGSAAVFQGNPDLVWVGTGEGSSRNSTAWGDGVYRSDDGGKTWSNLGLKETRHIPRIVLHPKNKDVAWVAGLGSLWGKSPDRGVYRTQDGGKTWEKTLFIDERTGIADIVINPKNPDELIASAWERVRTPYTFRSGGPSSGIFRSVDGGKNWQRVTKGLPVGPLGRIGLAYYERDPRIVMATIERPPHDPDGDGLANGEVVGGVFRSEDGGKSWSRTSLLNPRAFYFSTIKIDPNDDQRVYVLGVDSFVSEDGGRTFRNQNYRIHSDHHAMWIDPQDSHHLLMGTDGGVAQSRDRGNQWDMIDNFPVGQFYAVAFDNRKPFWVYGGLQDNGSWGGPSQGRSGAVLITDWDRLNGGDGFHVQVDPEDWRWAYSESQGGMLVRLNQESGRSAFIRPRAPQGEFYRFNWSSPIMLSPHNAQTIYFGGNRLFKSVDRGTTWRVISPDLSTNDPRKQRAGEGSVSPEQTSAENHCTIITISESPLRPGVIWVGTDDGRLWVTQNDGQEWKEVTDQVSGVPKGTWVSRVTASQHVVGRAYATFDGHRTNDMKSYVSVTEDFGQTWRKLSEQLPENDVAYVIREGSRNSSFLMLGTEMSLYISLDRGDSWTRVTSGKWPTVAVHDIAIHPRDQDAVIGTHGRSIWLLPVGVLEQLTAANLTKPMFLADPAPVYLSTKSVGETPPGDRYFASTNTQYRPRIYFHLAEAPSEDPIITVSTAKGEALSSLKGERKAGLQSVVWSINQIAQSGRLVPGSYRVVLKVGDRELVTEVVVENASVAPANR